MNRDKQPARDIRVGNAEREHVGKLLQQAVGEGRISIAEFDERMGVAMAARTQSELNTVLVDLPGAKPASMSYTAEISRANPTCLVFLVDQSTSMNEKIGSGELVQTKAQIVADALNRLLAELTVKCGKEEGVRDYFHIAVIGYGPSVRPAFGGRLSGRRLVPISEVADAPARLEQRRKRVPDGAGGLVEQTVAFPVWVDPVAGGITPMCETLIEAAKIVQGFIDDYPNCFPPVVLNLTDGDPTDGEPHDAAAALTSIRSTDGNVLLFNLHVCGEGARSISFPSSKKGLTDNAARLGLPRPRSGAAACVFSVTAPSTARYAVKCFTRAVPDRQDRYATIAEHLASGTTAPWQVGFDYRPRGVLVAGHWWPTVVMEWVGDGTGLAEYVNNHLAEPARLGRVATAFAQTCADLRARRIAHGDLQHGNILVTPDDRIRLVDYDGLWVPALADRPGIERGHPHYQPPQRRVHDTGPQLDHFSTWVIYLSLLATAVDATLWQRLAGGDDCLLFRATDLRDPAASPAFTALATSDSDLVRAAGNQMAELCRLASPLHAPPLDPDHLPVPGDLPAHRTLPTSLTRPSPRPATSIPAPRPPTPTNPNNPAPPPRPATPSTSDPNPTPQTASGRPPNGTRSYSDTLGSTVACMVYTFVFAVIMAIMFPDMNESPPSSETVWFIVALLGFSATMAFVFDRE